MKTTVKINSNVKTEFIIGLQTNSNQSINNLQEYFKITVLDNCILKIKNTVKINCFNYYMHNLNNNAIQLTIEYSDEIQPKQDMIRSLEFIYINIINISHSYNFYIIPIYDDISKYYCNELMPLIATFERKVRQLMYTLLLRLYDQATLYSKLIPNIKKQQDSQKRIIQHNTLVQSTQFNLAELFIYEFDFSLYEKYLFTSINNNPPIWNILINNHNNDKQQFENELNHITAVRNIVMHSKLIDYNNYNIAKDELNDLNSKLFKYILETSDMTSFNEVVKSLQKTLDQFIENCIQSFNDKINNEVSVTLSNFNLDDTTINNAKTTF